ncbi:MAG: DUF6519 domain-containing protein [Paracoccaceae bacterium]
MSGDYSRDSFDALKSFAGVFLQQGRAVLDSDWNTLVQMFERRIRAGTVDTIGRAVVPRETELAFEIQLTATGFEYGFGRLYLDGMTCESFGFANFDGSDPTRPDPVFDRARPGPDGPQGVLDEMIAPPEGDFTDYMLQPHWPTPEPLPADGRYMVYLVGWQREVTATEMPELLDPALGGLDSATRWQTVWQVRVLPDLGEGATCATPDEELPGWVEEIAPSTARLTNGTVDVDDPEDPCVVPPTEGYTGVENQFYRVEIHGLAPDLDPDDTPTQGDWRFKFSRENASVRASVTAVAEDAQSVTVARVGRDEVLRFSPGDWVELTDDIREFNHVSGQILRVADVDAETRTVEFEGTLEADLVPSGLDDDTLANRHTRLVRWDQRGVIRLDDGTLWIDLDLPGSDGLIPVPPDGRAIMLESGITVSFDTADGPGLWRPMDHWRFAARTAGTQIESLRNAPPDGVQRHYTRLAVVTPGTPNVPGQVLDCRAFWPPEFEGGEEGCACTVCVTAEEHNSGTLTIQDAINQVGPLGGSVCLDAGVYALREPVRIVGRGAIRLVGQGLGTILVYRGVGGAVQVGSSVDIRLERFSVLAAPIEDANGGMPPVHGVAAVNASLLAMRRLAAVVIAPNPEDRADFGIALDGTQVGAKVEECVAVAANALGSRSSYGLDEDGDLQIAAFAELRVADCILFGGRMGVRIDRSAINIAAAHLTRNLILSLDTGARINWAEIPAASLSIEGSTALANRRAMILSAGTLRVQDCEISGGDDFGDGIALVPNLLPETPTDAQIIGNTIFDLGGAGIRVAGQLDTLFIKRNIIRDCGEAGITIDPDAAIRHLAVDNNSVHQIGLAAARDFAVGILVTGTQTGQIVGNSVRDVGEEGFSGQVYAGIAVQGSGSIDISTNVISGIGGGQPESTSSGILAMPPLVGLNVGSNRIFGDLSQSDESSNWMAIRIGSVTPPDIGVIGNLATGYLAAVPGRAPDGNVYFRVAEDVWSASAGSFRIAFPSTPSQITVRGNQARSAQRVTSAMVWVFSNGARAIGLSDNQFDLQSGGGLSQVVLAAGPRLTVSSNTITHTTDATSMQLFSSPNGGAAVLGNVTTSGIRLNNGPLPAPFNTLNINA